MYFLYFNHESERGGSPGLIQYNSGNKVFLCPAPWDMFHAKIVRSLCHAHLSSSINDKFSLPFRSAWNKRLTRDVNDKDFCLIMCSHYFVLSQSGLVEYIHRKGGFVVFEFTDKYDFFRNHYKHFPSAEQLKKEYDLVLTYNVHDVKKYGFTLLRPRMKDYSTIIDDVSIPTSDVFFVGNNKGRLKQILEIFEVCSKSNLKCEFYVNNVEKQKQKYSDIIHYNEILPYNEVLKRVRRTKCVLNLVQENGEGITLRDYEALGMEKYLLTNNYAIKETALYDSKQVIWIEDLEERSHEIVSENIKGKNYFAQYNDEQWYWWLTSELLEKYRK